MTQIKPLEGMLVLDFSQFLAGPVAATRLADLGARVIKIERPGEGDIGRTLAFAGSRAGADTVSFHAMNRGKESVVADMKDPADRAFVMRLVERADVVIENFRPGVSERLGLDYASLREVNPRIVHGSITGYGRSGPWVKRPGQDLLAQSIAGLPWLSPGEAPQAVGLSVADHLASCHLAHGVTAMLLRRERTGEGGTVETSLLESRLDPDAIGAGFGEVSNGEHGAHRFLSAPYGIYPTADGNLSIAMNPVPKIGELLGIAELAEFADPQSWWDHQAEIEGLIAARLATRSTAEWLEVLDAADVWCAPVHTIDELVRHEGFAEIGMVQRISRIEADGARTEVETMMSPLRIDGERLAPATVTAAPVLGADSEAVRAELGEGAAHVG
jgi:crotonobetainyl-CoA:carnitine CoA-transferase CaiB-like acyl-CoA transferase